ncbi:type III secretion system chaperone [Pelagibius sp.]|uniref:type III secretion system chaperone n=1 Tax=Pelagibius sp. TaxID=1931238 RepID=UPI002618B02F|nr:type III secretion system chaperone [Pelagibius sp.]
MDRSAEIDFVRDLLAEVHEARQFHEVVEYSAEAVWVVSFDEDCDVILDYDGDAERLFIFCELGSPPEEAAFDTYRFFLQYNYQASETGGARVALRDEEGPLSLIYDLSEAELRAGTLPIVLDNLEADLPAWRALVAEGLKTEADSPPGDPMHHHSLRV